MRHELRPAAAPRSRVISWITVLFFAAALIAPSIDVLLRPEVARSVLRENRNPAEYPDPIVDLTTLSKFPAAFERWSGDRLGGRDVLLRAWQLEAAILAGLSPSPTILRGEGGFDFFAGDDSERVHRGMRPATVAELERWTRTLEAQRDRCRRLGAEFVFVLAPDKQSIYPDKWPRARPAVGPTRLDQFARWLESNTDVRFVDLRSALVDERAHDRPDQGDFVYHPLGSHFTWRGGFAAWQAVVAACADIEPPPRAPNRDDFAVRELPENENDSMWDQTYIGDRVHQRGYALDPVRGARPWIEYGPKNEIQESRIDDASLPSALFVHDSFGPWMLPFMTFSFSRMDSVWTHRLPRELIERHRPRIVIQELTERALTWGIEDLAPDVEHVSEAQFDAFGPLFGPLDCAKDPLFGTRGGVSIARTDKAWTIEQQSGDGLIVLPDAILSPGSDLGLHLSLETEGEGNLLLYYQTKADPRFVRARVLALNLHAGVNELHLRTRAPDLYGGLQVRLSRGGRYVLRAFEMRVAR